MKRILRSDKSPHSPRRHMILHMYTPNTRTLIKQKSLELKKGENATIIVKTLLLLSVINKTNTKKINKEVENLINQFGLIINCIYARLYPTTVDYTVCSNRHSPTETILF